MGAAALVGPGVWWLRGLGEGSDITQLVSIPVTVAPLLVALLVWRRRTTRPVPVTPTRLAEARGVLALAVRQRWDEEAQLRGLLPDPISVAWRVTYRDGLQDRPGAITAGSLLLFEGGEDVRGQPAE